MYGKPGFWSRCITDVDVFVLVTPEYPVVGGVERSETKFGFGDDAHWWRRIITRRVLAGRRPRVFLRHPTR